MRMSVQTRTVFGSVIASILIAGTGLTSIFSTRDLVQSNRAVSHTVGVTRDIYLLSSLLVSSQSYLRGYYLTSQDYYEHRHEQTNAAIPPLLRKIREETADSPSEQLLLDELEPLISERIRGWSAEKADFKTQGTRMILEDMRGWRGKVREKQIQDAISGMISEENRLLEIRTARSESTSQRSTTIIVLGAATAFLLVFLSTRLIIQHLKVRRRAEESLSETTETLEKLIYSSPVGILVFDLEHKLKLWNPACERSFGWKASEVLGQVPPLVTPEAQRGFEELVLKMNETREQVDVEGDAKRKDGRPIRIGVSAIPLIGEARESGEPGKIYGYMAILSDITDKSKADAELRKAKEEALRAARSKSEFLASMSHEIRTPLNGIIGMTDLLLETELDEQQKFYARVVQDSGNGLLTIVNDILDFSKIEAGKLDLEIIDFNLVSLIESQAELMAHRAREKNITLMAYIDPRIPAHLSGDPGRLGQIFLNLIGNSVKFTPSGSISVRADLLAKTGKNLTIRFSVTDTGIGMSKETQDKIFKPFTQADGSTARKYGGTGLGLSICKRLVEMMNGQIGVISQSDKGSTFWFTLTLESAKSIDLQEPARRDLTDMLPYQAKILIVDKEPIEREVMSGYLSNWKFHTQSAANGREAMEILNRASIEGAPFDVVLVDRKLEDMDGFEFAKIFKSQTALASASLILVTTYERSARVEFSHREGFSGYVTKPIKQSVLFNAVQEAILKGRRSFKAESDLKPQPVHAKQNVAQNSYRILVVEDNSVNQMLTMSMLKNLGYTAQAVANGKEAVEAVGQTSFDLVLMDCHMPEMDGYQATAEIRSREAGTNRHTPIIALTANAMTEDRQKCLECGMDDYLPKPIKKAQLAEIITRWIDKEAKAA